MKPEQTAATSLSPELPVVTSQRSRRAGRKHIPVAATQKAWLVLLAALAMTVLEGAFRKWVPVFGSGMGKYLMYFSKDIIFAMLIFFPKRSQLSTSLRVFENWMLPGCVLLAAGAALSCVNGLNPVGALLTARATILLPLIALLAVPRLAGLPLGRVIWLLIAFTVFNFALGVEQNRLPADSILNRYSEANAAVVSTDTGVRASGTFSYLAGMGVISAVGIWAGLALISLAKTQWQRIGAWAALAAGFGCGLAAVSRGPIVVGAAMVAGWAVCSRAGASALARGLVTTAFCVVVATGFGITPVFSKLGQGLMQRAENAGDSFNQRAFGQLGETVLALQMASLGNGFGTEQVAGNYYTTGQASFTTFESPLPRLVMETGFLGLTGYLLVCAGALLALQRAKRDAPDTGARIMLLATQMFLLPMFYGVVIFDHTASAFTWMIFAAVMAGAEQNRNVKVESRNADLKAETGNGGRTKTLSQRAPFSVTQAEKTEM